MSRFILFFTVALGLDMAFIDGPVWKLVLLNALIGVLWAFTGKSGRTAGPPDSTVLDALVDYHCPSCGQETARMPFYEAILRPSPDPLHERKCQDCRVKDWWVKLGLVK